MNDVATKLILRADAVDDSIVIYCSGRLTIETADQLKNEVKSAMPHRKHITLDLRDLAYMDSSGLGAIVGFYVTAKRERCDFQLVNYSDAIRKLLSLSNLLSLFEVCGRAGTRMT
jgi:anti-anti-sigma factor